MTTSSRLAIVGISGLPRSGKDTLAELFIEAGYYGVSLGDIVRDESRKRHAGEPDPISVKNMTESSNYLRSTMGPDFALKETLRRFETAQKQSGSFKGLVVFSVRARVEADYILEHEGRLIWVEASDEVRHQRGLEHRREGELDVTLEEMKAQEALQEKPQPGLPAAVQMNTAYIKQHATETMENNGNNLEEFLQKAASLININ